MDPQQIAHYRITAKLGEGGMGEVYRAVDTKLDREVALKILPAAFAADADRMARFEREAKVLASLNHPNIAQIYGVEERALVMELVEGETLKGPLPLDTALNYARQIADALEAAHDKGIIHRDLKPANVKVTPQGVVKVLDFGLAKAADERLADPQNSPTLTISPTQAGVILGTAAYMSPEQARGKPVDQRADIWAFGCVLFEMLTGRQAFSGETVSDILAGVLVKEPNLDATPAKVRPLLEKCLAKDPKQRLRAIGDWPLLLDEPVAATAPAQSRTGWLWPTVAALLLLVTLALAYVAYRHVTEEARVLRFPVLPPEKASFTGPPAISPDGRRIAFIARLDGKDSLWVRDLDSLAARAFPDTDGASYPFWSPDSRAIGFFASGKLKRIDATGGPGFTLADAPSPRGGSWSRNGVILFAPTILSGLRRVTAAGGSVTPVTELDHALSENAHRTPWFLPDGRHFLFTARSNDPEKNAIYVGDLDSKSRTRVLSESSNAVFVQAGYLIFMRAGTLMAQPFDPGKAQTTGDAVPVAEQVAYDSLNLVGRFAVSQNNILVYASGGASFGDAQLTWFDRSGKVTGTVGIPGISQWAAISPDGNTVVADRLDPQTGFFDLWLHDLTRGTASRFTFNSKTNQFPVWSPDGSHIAFHSTREGVGHVYRKAVGRAAQDEALDKNASGKRPDDWSRDGRYIIEETPPSTPKTGDDIWVLPLFGDLKPFPYLQTEFNEHFAKLSPNGRWLAYASDETKRNEIYVQTFPAPGGKWQVSTNGGARPVWSRDGKELFYIGADQKMMVVEVTGGAKFEASVPSPLFDTRLTSGNTWFDVSKDGRFLIPASVEQSTSVPMTVVVNWTAGLKK
ncbi:MAG: protein kinase [Acidobacteriia bacterium]|nr:protein kinase [Terriglobia bacterium]